MTIDTSAHRVVIVSDGNPMTTHLYVNGVEMPLVRAIRFLADMASVSLDVKLLDSSPEKDRQYVESYWLPTHLS